MNSQTKKLLILSSLALLLANSCFFTINQSQQALVLSFGKPVREIKTPGIKIKAPFIHDVLLFDKRLIDLSITEQEVIASDQKRLIINAFAKFQIVDALKFYTTVRTMESLNNKVSGILDSSMRQVIGEVTLSQLLTEDRGNIMNKIRDILSEQSEIFGIKIVDVRIMRADLPKENSEAIFNRMKTEREKEAREIRANGAEEAEKIRAEADKEKTIILAEAKKKADLIRGEGEGKSAKIFADSYGKDPEFADFYRSMIAYKNSLKNEKTKMLVSPDSEFFKYFGNSASK